MIDIHVYFLIVMCLMSFMFAYAYGKWLLSFEYYWIFHMLEICLLFESWWIKLLWSFELSWDELIMLNMCFPYFLKICVWVCVSMILIVLHLKHILHKTWFMRDMHTFSSIFFTHKYHVVILWIWYKIFKWLLLNLHICFLTITILNNIFNNWHQCAYFFVD